LLLLQDGQLTVGDQILEVGDKQLAGVHYDKVRLNYNNCV